MSLRFETKVRVAPYCQVGIDKLSTFTPIGYTGHGDGYTEERTPGDAPAIGRFTE